MALSPQNLRLLCERMADKALVAEAHQGTPRGDAPPYWAEPGTTGGLARYVVQIEEDTNRARQIQSCWNELMEEHFEQMLEEATASFLGTPAPRHQVG